MKIKQILIPFLACILGIPAAGQYHDALMQLVLENNRELRTAREAFQSSMLEAGTSNTPPDPQIEFGYLFGDPSMIGNRVDFSVSQQVDFPTAYLHRSRLRKIRNSRAELEYILARQEVLLNARKLWIRGIHLNIARTMITKRLGQAEGIHKHFQQKLEEGEVSQLAFNQSNLHLAALRAQMDELQTGIRGNRLALAEITGGTQVEILDSIFPAPAGISTDSILIAYREGASMQLYYRQLELKEEEKSLALSRNLPKLSAGYYSESVSNEAFRGVQIGISVPLWENHNKIKYARSEVAFAASDADRFLMQQQRDIRQKLLELTSLSSRVKTLEGALDEGKGMELLALSIESGEISLTDYFFASDFYFTNELRLLEYKRDRLLIEADLRKVYL